VTRPVRLFSASTLRAATTSTAYADALARDRAFVNPDIELMVMTYGSENLDFASAEQAAWP
jgi:hypothetical protein